MAAQQTQHDTDSIWDFPSRWEDYSLPRFAILSACKDNDIATVQRLIGETKWTPFELMIKTIYGNSSGSDVFDFLLPRLSSDEMTNTFLVPNGYGEEHTFLSLYCSNIFYREKIETVQEKIAALIQAGSQLDQEIGDGKTVLSYLVKSDCNIAVLKMCIERFGANPHKGHLLLNSCNSVNRQKRDERVEANLWYSRMLDYGGTPMAAPDEVESLNPFENIRVYRYLLQLGLDLEDCEIETGLTPLLAVCSEGNIQKVQALLQCGGPRLSFYRKTNEGLDVWFWAEEYKFKRWGLLDPVEYDYPLRDVLSTFEAEQSLYWEDVMAEASLEESLLQDVPVRDMLHAVVKI